MWSNYCLILIQNNIRAGIGRFHWSADLNSDPFVVHYSTKCYIHNKIHFAHQIAKRDILSSIDREMSGDVKSAFKAVGE